MNKLANIVRLDCSLIGINMIKWRVLGASFNNGILWEEIREDQIYYSSLIKWDLPTVVWEVLHTADTLKDIFMTYHVIYNYNKESSLWDRESCFKYISDKKTIVGTTFYYSGAL